MSADADVYAAIKTLLVATGEFGLIRTAEEAGLGPEPADLASIVTISHITGTDEDLDSHVMTRQCRYDLQIELRNEDPEARDDELGRLGAAVRNAINNQSLASITLPRLTRIRDDRTARAKQPNDVVTLRGEFTYIVSTPTSYDET